jgi:DNA primase
MKNMQIQELKSRHSLEEVVTNYLGDLQQIGDRFKCRCPFHDDTNASFVIFQDQRFKCFGCGLCGDVIDFVQLIEKTDFRGAIEILREKNPTFTKNPKISKYTAQRSPEEKFLLNKREISISLQKLWLNRLDKARRKPVKDHEYYTKIHRLESQFDLCLAAQQEIERDLRLHRMSRRGVSKC